MRQVVDKTLVYAHRVRALREDGNIEEAQRLCYWFGGYIRALLISDIHYLVYGHIPNRVLGEIYIWKKITRGRSSAG